MFCCPFLFQTLPFTFLNPQRLNSVLMTMKKQLRFAHIKIYFCYIWLSINIKLRTHTQNRVKRIQGNFSTQKIRKFSFTLRWKTHFHFDGSLNICCFVLCWSINFCVFEACLGMFPRRVYYLSYSVFIICLQQRRDNNAFTLRPSKKRDTWSHHATDNTHYWFTGPNNK